MFLERSASELFSICLMQFVDLLHMTLLINAYLMSGTFSLLAEESNRNVVIIQVCDFHVYETSA